jgi:hypothetical protein
MIMLKAKQPKLSCIPLANFVTSSATRHLLGSRRGTSSAFIQHHSFEDPTII